MSDELARLFDVAKKVGEELDKLPKPDRAKVLRWVAESLGEQVSPAAPAHSPASAPSVSSPPSPPEHAPSDAVHRPTDIKSFVESKQPKSDMQYVAVVAYYYRFEAPEEQRRDTIDAEALQESTRQAGWKRLAAARVTLNNALAQGYIDRAERGQYRINTVGENLVAMTLPGGADTSRPARKKKQTKKATAKKTLNKTAKKTSRKKQ